MRSNATVTIGYAAGKTRPNRQPASRSGQSSPLVQLHSTRLRASVLDMKNGHPVATRAAQSEDYLATLRALEDEASATAFGLECRAHQEEVDRQLATMKRHARMDDITSEILEGFTSIGAGTLSTLQAGGFPLGAAINAAIGTVAKAGAIATAGDRSDTPGGRALRLGCQAGKVLLHSQLSIATRNLILGQS